MSDPEVDDPSLRVGLHLVRTGGPAKAQAMQNPAKDAEERGFEPLRPCGLPVFKLLAGWG